MKMSPDRAIEFRETWKKDADTWKKIEFEELIPKDLFKLFDRDQNRTIIGIVESKPEPCLPEGNWQFNAFSFLYLDKDVTVQEAAKMMGQAP